MSSEEFHALLDEYGWESELDRRDEPLTLARLAELERQKGVRFPAFYKEFLSMHGAGDFGGITVLSPDPQSNQWVSNQFGKPSLITDSLITDYYRC
jgi:phosphopantetheinyl transferase